MYAKWGYAMFNSSAFNKGIWRGSDFKNVSIVGHYIKERTKNAQFIIIR